MKKSVLIIIDIVLAVVLLVLLLLPSLLKTEDVKDFDGNSKNSRIIDEDNKLENSEELEKLVQETSEKLEMNICIYIASYADSTKSDYQIECFAHDTYYKLYGKDTNGVLYYMDVSGRSPAYDYISTSGKAILIYQENIQRMFSYINNYLPPSGQTVYSGDIQNAIEAFLSQLESYNRTTLNSLSYYYDKSSGNYIFAKHGKIIILKYKPVNIIYFLSYIIIGFIVLIIFYFVTKFRYRFKKSQNSSVYVKRDKTVFRQKSDTFIRSYTTKHKIETNNNNVNRSSGSGGGHSNSGTHGGGGSHR